MDSSRLAGQVVIVTGASSGIGRATASAFDHAGANVVLVARREKELRQIASGLSSRSTIACADVSQSPDVLRVVQDTLSSQGRIDGLVNNAGVGSFAPVVSTDLADLRRMFDVNVFGSFMLAQAVLPAMIRRRDGWIINVCSDVSKRVFPGGAAYCASKFAQYAMSLTMTKECRQHGVRVGAVLPGMVGTPFADGKPEDRADWVLQPEDVAEAIIFMATRPKHAVVDELTVHPIQQDF